MDQYIELQNYYNELPKAEIGHLTLSQYENLKKHIIPLYNVKEVLETGFNMGHSSLLWLTVFPQANITSIDIGGHEAIEIGLKYIKNTTLANRFTYIKKSSEFVYEEIKNIKYDFMFLDGDHSFRGCTLDLELADKLKIPYVLVDDYNNLGEVKEAVNAFLFGNPNYSLTKILKATETEIMCLLIKSE